MDSALLRFELEWTEGDKTHARALANDYVMWHVGEFVEFRGMDTTRLVAEVTAARAHSNVMRRIRLEIFLLTQFKSPDIHGVLDPKAID